MDPVPLTGVETIHPNSKQTQIPQIKYSEEAKKYINFRRQRMIAARDLRDMKHEEFDDFGFQQYYEILKKADDQYVAPRINKQDTSINAGTIRDKDTTLVEYACKYDFEPVAQVFNDEDEMMEDLAEVGEDLVRKSKLMEDYKSKAKLIYRSMVAFGTALVEDAWVERWTLEKTFGKGAKLGADSTEWEQKYVKKYDGCQAKLWDLRKCYFGDIRKFFMNGPQGQPYFFTVEYESYDVTKQTFGDLDRWKYVPNTVVITPELSTPAATFQSWWTLRPITLNYCEIVRYYDPIMNEFAITINGVDMLPIMDKTLEVNGVKKQLISGFPLTAISPSGAIPFAKYDLEPMHDYAYSKSQPAKMRVFADVENMMVKAFIGMFKQKWKPTMGNKSGRVFGAEVTDPASVINDIRDGDLFPILPNYQGAQPADFSFYKTIKAELSKNSVEDSFQGIDGSDQDPKKKTATQDMNDLKAQSLKVASLFDGIIAGENQLNWLRTYNIAKNWTKPIDTQIDVLQKSIQNKYRTVTLSSEIDGGQKTTKKIIFTKDTTPARSKGKSTLEDSQKVHQEEMDHANEHGSEIRLAYLHPEQFATLKLNWSYTSVPVPNGSDPLSYMLFAKQINDAAQFFGPDSLNTKKLKHRFASLTGNDFDTWFLKEKELEQKRQQAQQQIQGGAPSAGAPPGVIPGKTQGGQPTIAGAVSGANPMAGAGSMMK